VTTDVEARVRSSFDRQPFMATLGASLARVEAGAVDIRLPMRADLTQQHGFLHASAVAAIADSACGYAAFSLMPPDTGVLSIEYKINLMAPARGDEFLARGRVVRAGRTITVCEAEVVAITAGAELPVALLISTVMTVRDRPDVRD
jgi:uncharacterized protein (TIGR00369 family)